MSLWLLQKHHISKSPGLSWPLPNALQYTLLPFFISFLHSAAKPGSQGVFRPCCTQKKPCEEGCGERRGSTQSSTEDVSYGLRFNTQLSFMKTRNSQALISGNREQLLKSSWKLQALGASLASRTGKMSVMLKSSNTLLF